MAASGQATRTSARIAHTMDECELFKRAHAVIPGLKKGESLAIHAKQDIADIFDELIKMAKQPTTILVKTAATTATQTDKPAEEPINNPSIAADSATIKAIDKK